MNPLAVLHILGILLSFTGAMMIFPLICALIYQEGDALALLISGTIALAIGLPLWWINRANRQLQIKDGFIIVTFGWILISVISALPFVLHGSIPSYTDAFFETMSGYTTTGATILNNIEAIPHGFVFDWISVDPNGGDG